MVRGYHLLQRLSRPGAAPIWAAEDDAGRRVALKGMLPSDRDRPDLLYRFQTEGRLQQELGGQHHLLHCYETRLDPEPTLILEFASGGSLRDRVEQGLLPVARAVDITCQIADALDWLHSNGVYHRDVKPSNILIMEDDTVRLADLGVAACGSPPRGLPDGWIEEDVGTLGYAAPELLRDPGLATAAIDVYALGVTLCELLTGRLPWTLSESESQAAFRARLAQGPMPELPGGLDEPIRSVVAKATAPNPAHRYPTAAALGAALTETVDRRG